MLSDTVFCEAMEGVDWQDLSTCTFTDQLAIFRLYMADNSLINSNVYTFLEPGEQLRAARYRRQDDRNRFVYGRAMAKVIIGRFTNQNPTTVQFVNGVNNKPELASITDLYFNVSHTANWILLAVGRTSVGVDVEKIIPDFAFPDILRNSFSLEEQHYVNASANPNAEFYRLWTRKEALVKATAKGMDDDFSHIPSLDGEHLIRPGLIGKRGPWIVTSFSMENGYAAALAHTSDEKIPKFYTVKSGLHELL